MADVTATLSAPVTPRETAAPETTKLYDLAARLATETKGTVTERKAAGEKLAQTYEQGAAEGKEALTDVTQTAAAHRTAREAARPVAPALAKPPSTAPRPFLEPGPSILSQMHTVLTGVGLLGLAAKGLRGSATAAILAHKGAVEGWQAGDRDRVERELASWKTHTETLLREHRLQREAYEDLLLDQKTTMDEKLRAIDIRAKLTGNQTMAAAVRVQNIDAILGAQEAAQKAEIDLAKALAQIAHWHAQERIRLGIQVRTDEWRTKEAERKERFHKDLMGRLEGDQALRHTKPLLAYTQALLDFEKVRHGLQALDRDGLLPKDMRLAPQWIATMKQKLAPNHPGLALVKYLENPLTIGFFDRTLYDEKGARALQIFQKQLTGLEPMNLATGENLINQLEDSIRTKRVTTVGVLEAAIQTPQMQNVLGLLNREWDDAMQSTPWGTDDAWQVETAK